ncbi:MAG TPA: hypothetical protein VKU40_12835 [Thermoanaerobaculia bacterium]|nr:hypothetical protein [Thermoanaerobaculia bacterium]
MTEPASTPWTWRVLLALHLLWALAGLALCLLLATATTGHPPGIAFLPFAAGAWGLGHLFLYVAGRLARAGVERTGSVRWPPALLAALLGSGGVAALGLFVLASLSVQRQALDAWTATLAAVWLPHVVVFSALLLRRRWARPRAVALALFWVLVLVVQVFTTTDVRAWEWPVVALLIAALGALALALWRSDAVRRALA